MAEIVHRFHGQAHADVGLHQVEAKVTAAHDGVLLRLVVHHAAPVHLRPGVLQRLEQLGTFLAVADDVNGHGLQPPELSRQVRDGINVHHVVDGAQVAQVQAVGPKPGLVGLVRGTLSRQVNGVLLRQAQPAAEQPALGNDPIRSRQVLIPQPRPDGKRQGQQLLHGAGGERLRPHIEDLEYQLGIRVAALEAGAVMGQIVGGQLGHHHIRRILLQLLEHQPGKVPV